MEDLLKVEDLKVHFPIRRGLLGKTVGYVYAVDGVSFRLGKGETIGLVGESGCGKTTTGLAVLRLIEPTDGKVTFQEKDVSEASKSELRMLKREMQIIFQDPFSSLNPRIKVRSIIGEPMLVHNIASDVEKENLVMSLLRKVGLESEHVDRFPHEFSGGQVVFLLNISQKVKDLSLDGNI